MSQDHCLKLLRNIARAGVYHAPQAGMAELITAAEAAGFSIHRIDLAMVRDKGALLDRLATSLEFPAWFGHNWDALADCLADLSWLQANGYLILLEHCDGFRAARAEDFITLLQIFQAAAEAWRESRVPFWVLVDMHADGIAHLPAIE